MRASAAPRSPSNSPSGDNLGGYTGDLPNLEHLSQFAPSAQSPVIDSCLASPSMTIPFDRAGKTLQNALAAAEASASLPDQIAWTLMCNHTRGMGRYHLNGFRLSWHIRRRFSAQQVFTIYANRAYFGSGATGVENASMQFFRKDADALNVEDHLTVLSGFHTRVETSFEG